MGKFVDKIRKKLGLQPERKTTLTGKTPNKVIVNRSVEEEADTGGTGGAGGYPFYVVPTPAIRPSLGDPKVDIGTDKDLKSKDKEKQLRRRKAVKLFKAFREDTWPSTAIDSPIPTAYANPSTPIPTVLPTTKSSTIKSKKKKLKETTETGTSGENGSPQYGNDVDQGATATPAPKMGTVPNFPPNPFPKKVKKVKTFKEMMESEYADGYDDKNADTESGCYRRGTEVIVNKDGYKGRGFIDYFDRSSKSYLVSMDGGHNIHVHHDHLKPVKGGKK